MCVWCFHFKDDHPFIVGFGITPTPNRMSTIWYRTYRQIIAIPWFRFTTYPITWITTIALRREVMRETERGRERRRETEARDNIWQIISTKLSVLICVDDNSNELITNTTKELAPAMLGYLSKFPVLLPPNGDTTTTEREGERGGLYIQTLTTTTTMKVQTLSDSQPERRQRWECLCWESSHILIQKWEKNQHQVLFQFLLMG